MTDQNSSVAGRCAILLNPKQLPWMNDYLLESDTNPRRSASDVENLDGNNRQSREWEYHICARIRYRLGIIWYRISILRSPLMDYQKA